MTDKEYELLIIRLDERTQNMQSDIRDIRNEIASFKVEIKQELTNIRENLDKYVTKDQFTPIQRAVFAVVGFIVMAVISSVISMVIIKPPIGR